MATGSRPAFDPLRCTRAIEAESALVDDAVVAVLGAPTVEEAVEIAIALEALAGRLFPGTLPRFHTGLPTLRRQASRRSTPRHRPLTPHHRRSMPDQKRTDRDRMFAPNIFWLFDKRAGQRQKT
ncbi:hypothetical protein [Streptosporangium sp. 'caverna']|uniref:hypothetical protein n=1 Tax=Streptosporangium sp. 'caverna' TaxID=2202249 RepID=UPI000D7E734E|nr:hypothetical protein [Streptosporangium sp. 'caverna']AWS40307.1 hypothetical protein DKM19_02120 [Streptosporangium sp. 'caverna']